MTDLLWPTECDRRDSEPFPSLDPKRPCTHPLFSWSSAVTNRTRLSPLAGGREASRKQSWQSKKQRLFSHTSENWRHRTKHQTPNLERQWYPVRYTGGIYLLEEAKWKSLTDRKIHNLDLLLETECQLAWTWETPGTQSKGAHTFWEFSARKLTGFFHN